MEIASADAFDLFPKLISGAMPAVVVTGTGDDSLRCGEAFEFTAEFGKRGGVIDDEISGEGDEVRFFLLKGLEEFGDEDIILSWAIVNVGELREAEAIECFWPIRKAELFVGNGKKIGFNADGPDSTGNTNA